MTCQCCDFQNNHKTQNTHSWRRTASLSSGWTPPHTALPCWAGSFACLGGKTGVCLRTQPRPHHYLPQPFAPSSSGLDSSPGGAAPRPGGDTPVGVPFLSRWRPGLCHRGPHTGSRAASEQHQHKTHVRDLINFTMMNKDKHDKIIWSSGSSNLLLTYKFIKGISKKIRRASKKTLFWLSEKKWCSLLVYSSSQYLNIIVCFYCTCETFIQEQ